MDRSSDSARATADEAPPVDFAEMDGDDRQAFVDRVFDRVAARYDLMNDVMSGGLHRFWKSELVNWLSPPRASPRRFEVLDIAGGTGDVAVKIAERSAAARVTILDINPAMIEVGRQRIAERDIAPRIRFLVGNAEALPVLSGSFDSVTIAFGIRNVPRIHEALREAFRVLRPGGRLLVLEFSRVDVAGLDKLYELYAHQLIPRMGAMIAGDEGAYRYLVESIGRFPPQQRFLDMLGDAGFGRRSYRNLTGGIAALHSGWRL